MEPWRTESPLECSLGHEPGEGHEGGRRTEAAKVSRLGDKRDRREGVDAAEAAQKSHGPASSGRLAAWAIMFPSGEVARRTLRLQADGRTRLWPPVLRSAGYEPRRRTRSGPRGLEADAAPSGGGSSAPVGARSCDRLQVLPRPDEFAQGFFGRGRNPDGDELARPMQSSQIAGVGAVGLLAHPRRLGKAPGR